MKTALVTGSTKGIGKAIAFKLLEQNCYVNLNYCSDKKEAELVDIFLKTKYPNQYEIIQADLSSTKGINKLVAKIPSDKSIDYLILNAAITNREPFEKMTYESWQHVIDANLTIPIFIVQEFAHRLNENGRIIFIGTIMGEYPHSISIAYGVSKAGLHFAAKSLVKIFKDQKITVNVIAPGFVNTPWQNKKQLEHRKRIEEKIALRRFAEPEEIADMVLCVINNPYINGSVLNIDGGYITE